jgi:hypothetical protein
MNIYHTQFSLRAAMRSLSNTNETIDDSTLSALTQQCVLVPGDRNGVWYDRDGLKLVHYFPSLYKTESLQHLLIQLHNLLHVFPPSRPALYEKRSTKYQEWSEQLGPDVPTGVIRLTYHHQQGHPHEPKALEIGLGELPLDETSIEKGGYSDIKVLAGRVVRLWLCCDCIMADVGILSGTSCFPRSPVYRQRLGLSTFGSIGLH